MRPVLAGAAGLARGSRVDTPDSQEQARLRFQSKGYLAQSLLSTCSPVGPGAMLYIVAGVNMIRDGLRIPAPHIDLSARCSLWALRCRLQDIKLPGESSSFVT